MSTIDRFANTTMLMSKPINMMHPGLPNDPNTLTLPHQMLYNRGGGRGRKEGGRGRR